MATMIDGESSVGRVLMRPLSHAGDLRLYCWPLRCLKSHMGGPTFGIEVKGEEMLRFDAHGPRGHWHQGGYDKLGAGGSHQGFPEGVVEPASQLAWSFAHLPARAQQLLAGAGYPAAAASLDPELLASAFDAVQAHVEQEGDLRAHAIAQGLRVVERPAPSLAALSAGCVIHFQGRPYGSCGPYRCHGDRVEDAGGGVDHGGPRDRGRPVRQPLLRVRRAWQGTVCPRSSTRQPGTRRCKAMSSTEMVCVHGAHGRPRWERSSRALPSRGQSRV